MGYEYDLPLCRTFCPLELFAQQPQAGSRSKHFRQYAPRLALPILAVGEFCQDRNLQIGRICLAELPNLQYAFASRKEGLLLAWAKTPPLGYF
jgi:hypothetical protein